MPDKNNKQENKPQTKRTRDNAEPFWVRFKYQTDPNGNLEENAQTKKNKHGVNGVMGCCFFACVCVTDTSRLKRIHHTRSLINSVLFITDKSQGSSDPFSSHCLTKTLLFGCDIQRGCSLNVPAFQLVMQKGCLLFPFAGLLPGLRSSLHYTGRVMQKLDRKSVFMHLWYYPELCSYELFLKCLCVCLFFFSDNVLL